MNRRRGLKSREIGQLFDHVRRMKHDGVTFLFISHHLQEIYEICERVAVMRDGRLVEEAAVGDFDQNALVAAMVGESFVAEQRNDAATDTSRRQSPAIGRCR